jgi:hypothetical protein
MPLTRDEFDRLVDEARTERPLLFDLEPDAPPDDEAIRDVGRQLGSTLPDDFVWFLRKYGGGNFGFASVYSADDSSDLYLPDNQSGDTSGFVAVSDDGTGNLFGFRVADGTAEDGVIIWEHETGSAEPTGTPFLDWLAKTALHPA